MDGAAGGGEEGRLPTVTTLSNSSHCLDSRVRLYVIHHIYASRTAVMSLSCKKNEN